MFKFKAFNSSLFCGTKNPFTKSMRSLELLYIDILLVSKQKQNTYSVLAKNSAQYGIRSICTYWSDHVGGINVFDISMNSFFLEITFYLLNYSQFSHVRIIMGTFLRTRRARGWHISSPKGYREQRRCERTKPSENKFQESKNTWLLKCTPISPRTAFPDASFRSDAANSSWVGIQRLVVEFKD